MEATHQIDTVDFRKRRKDCKTYVAEESISEKIPHHNGMVLFWNKVTFAVVTGCCEKEEL